MRGNKTGDASRPVAAFEGTATVGSGGWTTGRRRPAAASLIALVAAAFVVPGWAVRDRTAPRAFHAVADGVFRSAQLEGDPLEGVLREYGIRTIVRLNGTRAADPRTAREDETARARGVRVFVFNLPPQGLAGFADLDRVADLIADPGLRPILVHCEAGLHRTSAALAAWRLRYCGWTWERTSEEIHRFGPRVSATSPLRRHLAAYAAACSTDCPAVGSGEWLPCAGSTR